MRVEQELEDRWWFGLRGTSVNSVEVSEFSVALSFGAVATLTIESEATLGITTSSDRSPALTQNPDGAFVASDEFKSLVGQRVVSGVGFKTGSLRLVFESGVMLNVPAGDAYESWQLTGPSGRLWVSVPGGGIVTFPPATQDN